MIRNRYNYPTPPIRDIKGKETQTRNNWTLMETSLAESQTDNYFKQSGQMAIQNKNKPWQKNRLGTVSGKYFTGGLKSILRGHNPRPYFCRGLDTKFVQYAWRLPNSSVLHLREHKKSTNYRNETTMRTRQHETIEMLEQKKTNSKTSGPDQTCELQVRICWVVLRFPDQVIVHVSITIRNRCNFIVGNFFCKSVSTPFGKGIYSKMK